MSRRTLSLVLAATGIVSRMPSIPASTIILAWANVAAEMPTAPCWRCSDAIQLDLCVLAWGRSATLRLWQQAATASRLRARAATLIGKFGVGRSATLATSDQLRAKEIGGLMRSRTRPSDQAIRPLRNVAVAAEWPAIARASLTPPGRAIGIAVGGLAMSGRLRSARVTSGAHGDSSCRIRRVRATWGSGIGTACASSRV